MRSRKQLLAEKRIKNAMECKNANRDRFIRRLLIRNGITPAHTKPELECFRGYKTYVSSIFPVHQCLIGVIAGCAFCRKADTGFTQIQNGQTQNLAFECRADITKPKLWIMQPGEFIKHPGIHIVNRTKVLVDAHGHILQNPVSTLPRIIPRPPAAVDDFAAPEPTILPILASQEAIEEAIARLDPATANLVRQAIQDDRITFTDDGQGNIEMRLHNEESPI